MGLEGGGLLREASFLGGLLGGGASFLGGVLGGVVSQHALRQTPPVNRITHSCKNITLATISLRPVKMSSIDLYIIKSMTDRAIQQSRWPQALGCNMSWPGTMSAERKNVHSL